MNVKQPLAKRLIFQCRRVGFEGAPVFGISPLLMPVEFHQIRVHECSPKAECTRVVRASTRRTRAYNKPFVSFRSFTANGESHAIRIATRSTHVPAWYRDSVRGSEQGPRAGASGKKHHSP